jgi:hypothetical protein
MEISTSWGKWKEMMRTAVNAGEFAGLSEDRIKGAAYRFAGFFAGHLEPANPEQRLLQELWLEGTEDERRALTSMLLKMLNREDQQVKHLAQHQKANREEH